MGRSVSYPKNSAAICFKDCSHFGMTVPTDDDDGNEITGQDDVFDEFLAQMDFNDFKQEIINTAKKNWPSFNEADRWLDREDHVLLENQFACIGISEYGGLFSVWLVSKETLGEYNTYYSDEAKLANMADAWCSRIANNFHKLFGEYTKVGTFSNGESIYQKVAKL